MSSNYQVRNNEMEWMTPLLDDSGREVGQARILLSPGRSRQAVEDLAKQVYLENADLNRTVTQAVERSRETALELMNNIKYTKSKLDVQGVGLLLSTLVDFSKYLQNVYATLNVPQQLSTEGAVHITKHAPPSGSNEDIYSLTFAPYVSPGGALQPKLVYGQESLVQFLVDDLHVEPTNAQQTVAELQSNRSTTLNQILLTQREAKALGFG